jgi:hypothetical protein
MIGKLFGLCLFAGTGSSADLNDTAILWRSTMEAAARDDLHVLCAEWRYECTWQRKRYFPSQAS